MLIITRLFYILRVHGYPSIFFSGLTMYSWSSVKRMWMMPIENWWIAKPLCSIFVDRILTCEFLWWSINYSLTTSAVPQRSRSTLLHLLHRPISTPHVWLSPPMARYSASGQAIIMHVRPLFLQWVDWAFKQS